MKKEGGRQNKRHKLIVVILTIIIILLVTFCLCIVKYNNYNKHGMENIFKRIESQSASLTEYIVYGTHLNIKGKINENIQDIKNVNLILADISGKEEKIELNYNEDENSLEFYTSDLINAGIDLENIPVSKHYILIEVKYGDKSNSKYYTIENKTSYAEVEYYTITKNHSNNKIDINFGKYEKEENDINYMQMEVKKAKLPKEVYDIVVDPGHGGSDNGAEYNGYSESDLTIEYAKKVKTELEKLGLKVKITRDGTEDEENFGTQTVYDKNGRVNIVGRSKAKYVLSIHLNSITEPNSESGVEIYAPSKADLRIARAFASNIVKYANTNYSTLEATYKKHEGVYVRTFKDWEIEDSNKEAEKAGYNKYKITNDTPYLYMIRETGGIATRAYVDGRNTKYGANMYYNSNIGVEAYLLELGYMNNNKNLQKLLSDKDLYVKGIVETVKEQIL